MTEDEGVDRVHHIIVNSLFVAKRHELEKRLAALEEQVMSVRAFNSLLPCASESQDVYVNLTAAIESIRRALELMRLARRVSEL